MVSNILNSGGNMEYQVKSLDFLGFPEYTIDTLGVVKYKDGRKALTVDHRKERPAVYFYVEHKKIHLKRDLALLMATCFIYRPLNYRLRFKDGNDHNYCLENLEWVKGKNAPSQYPLKITVVTTSENVNALYYPLMFKFFRVSTAHNDTHLIIKGEGARLVKLRDKFIAAGFEVF